ncbi:DUF3889 domain-containing protein [Alicyclobacillus contaminans]|uniref:DUF3889 domain-containing protein n=1 Tax=Alicyclobacillus contaminans TaxID=392016 RepID=UPI00041B877D|nr:DUF3889 domain-containing protein [Alicyclobacillus contaminans]
MEIRSNHTSHRHAYRPPKLARWFFCLAAAAALAACPGSAWAGTQAATPPTAPYSKPIPPYAKWGKLAVQQAQRCYPRAQVVDYLHLGRSEQGHGRAEEAFRLWLREGKQEWGVVVRLQFNVQTEALLRVRCERVP